MSKASLTRPRLAAVRPLAAISGGRVTVRGTGIGGDPGRLPDVRFGEVPARVVYADRDTVACCVPAGLGGGATEIRLSTAPGETAFLDVGTPVATGLHQVDSPVFGDDGVLYLTHSGARGSQSPVSIFRVGADGFCESFVTGLTNPTSLAFQPGGRLLVSSRFDGTVSAVDSTGHVEEVATDLGVACGLALDAEGTLHVGDRSGTVFRVTATGEVSRFATLPPSVAAFHLAMAPTGALFVTGPTLGTRDAVYRIDPDGIVSTVTRQFGRPQGLAFDPHGTLYVVEALAGAAGLYRLPGALDQGDGEELRGANAVDLVVAAPSLVGVAFDGDGAAVVVSESVAYRFDRLPSASGFTPRPA
jgi:sugar lactone lactonase YvrE